MTLDLCIPHIFKLILGLKDQFPVLNFFFSCVFQNNFALVMVLPFIGYLSCDLIRLCLIDNALGILPISCSGLHSRYA